MFILLLGAGPWAAHIQVTLNNTIIRNLGGAAKAIDQFEKGIAAFNGSLINTLQVMKNNMYFANWMGLVMLAAFVPQIVEMFGALWLIRFQNL